MFQELKYIYTGTEDYDNDRDFYLNILQANLVWEFSRFGARVCALQVGSSSHLTLLADHLKSGRHIYIYRTQNLDKAIQEMKKRNVEFLGAKFPIPDGICIKFGGVKGTEFAIYEQTKPDSYLTDEYTRQLAEKTESR